MTQCNEVLNFQSLVHPHPILGNGQHVGVAAVVLAAALFSVEFFEEVPPISAAINTTDSMRQQARCDVNGVHAAVV